MMEKEDAGHDNSSEDATTNVNQQDNAGVDTQTDVSSKAKNIINHDEIEWQITQDVDNSSSREAVVAFDLKDDGSLNMSCSEEVNNELDSKQPLLEASSEPNATRDATSESLKNVATPVDVDEDNHETSALIAKEGAPLKSAAISVNNDVTIQNNQSKSEIIDDINLNININNKNSNNESDNEGSDDNIDCSIDDALDEGCMDLQGTLERGFSLQESSQTSDRAKLYEQMRINYQHETLASKRYAPALKHFIPVRSEKCAPLEMPVDKTGMVSYTMFSWMTPIMWRAYKKGLTQEDMPICSKYDMCDYNTQRLERLWNAELQQKGPAKASLQRVVWKFIRTRVYFGLLLFIVTLMFGFVGPTIFMRYLIEWLSTEEPVSTGLLWVVGLILTDLCRILTFGLVWAVNYRTGVRLRSACLGLVYKKLMRLSALGDKSVGEMINLFANDGQRIFDFVVLGVMIIGGPVVGVGGVAYILWLLGPYALCGMLAFLLFYPLQYGISRLTGVLRRRTVTVTDERVRLMNELLACIKLIKMYAWEDSFASAIDEVRQKEKVLLEKSAYVQSVSLAMAPTVPVIAAILTFVAHIAAGNNLTPAQVR
uniref:Multidrug resistance-associated protein 5-like n=1 Tax=Hirondellea gigas TaxID=1518452 RepID=A0A2P2I628_9CRUS